MADEAWDAVAVLNSENKRYPKNKITLRAKARVPGDVFKSSVQNWKIV